jgi:hypothetical protein
MASHAIAQTPATLYTWGAAGNQDWFRNFGAGGTSATLSNPGGALQITETSATAGGSQAFSDGFNTIREGAPFSAGCCGGLDLTGLDFLEFDLGHNGVAPVDVQFFTQATPGSVYQSFTVLDVPVMPGMNTYSLPLSGLSANAIAYMRTIGMNIRDHAAQGNLVWTLGEVRSVGPSLVTRTIADHNGGAADFDGVICNFECGAIVGGNGGQNNSGMSVVDGALQYTDAGGSAGAAITWGNGTQNSGGSFNARPVDLSNYDVVKITMSAAGIDPSVGVQFYMQTGSGFTYQSLDSSLTVDGKYHTLRFPLAGITNRSFVDTNGFNLFGHPNSLAIRVDRVVYEQVPEPTAILLVGLAMTGCLGLWRRARRA